MDEFPMKKALAILAVVAAIAAAAGWWWMRQSSRPPAAPPAPEAPPAVAQPAPAPAEPAIRHPIEPQAEAPGAPQDLESGVTELLGKKQTLAWVQMENLARRVVATVDNLGRGRASPRLWPVPPTAGRFTVETRGSDTVIAPDNGLRYAPFLQLVESVDARRAVSLYKRFYPVFQRAYEELGYPGRYFNDRLVEVIDVLLQTPEMQGPLKVEMPAIPPETPVTRPWVLYEFSDPALASLTSGQKLLLRMGPVNERRAKAKLKEVRALLAGGQAAAAPRAP